MLKFCKIKLDSNDMLTAGQISMGMQWLRPAGGSAFYKTLCFEQFLYQE